MSKAQFSCLLILQLVNIWLSLFGQDLAYQLEKAFGEFHPVTYLTAITVIGMVMYLFVLMFLIWRKLIKRRPASNYVYILILSVAIELPINLWALFVLVMCLDNSYIWNLVHAGRVFILSVREIIIE